MGFVLLFPCAIDAFMISPIFTKLFFSSSVNYFFYVVSITVCDLYAQRDRFWQHRCYIQIRWHDIFQFSVFGTSSFALVLDIELRCSVVQVPSSTEQIYSFPDLSISPILYQRNLTL